LTYRLYYWPTIQGRGEFVRLALEQAGAPYVDVARTKDGSKELRRLLAGDGVDHPPFALPALQDGDVVVAQTAAILLYLGPLLGLAPETETGRLWAHQIQLTISDLVEEAHNTHHPVGSALYYEDQKPEAARAAEGFRRERMPRFFGWLETVLARDPASEWLVERRLGYVDLSAFQDSATRSRVPLPPASSGRPGWPRWPTACGGCRSSPPISPASAG
jgi:glutathione S-transferase